RAARERLRAIGVGRSGRGPILFQVRSPIAGVVTDRNVVAGDPVTETSVIATVVSAEEVWFVGRIFERDVARVREGRSAVVVLNAHPEEMFEGTVTNISLEVDPGARTLSARIPLKNRDGKLRLGLFGTASIVVDAEPIRPEVTVPRSAVTEVLGEDVVFVRMDDGHFELHDVTLGRFDAEHVEVVHGLRVGEHVVSEGVFNLKSVLLRDTFGEDGH
ncbi:MAG: efflux RND transporter periplasmic adaptor subunit, partial [Nannocystaceae bacterium]|nr:efflux RND transporter periplasmic adaptor subunit [Nannocystaceae bacterium]